MGYLCKKSPIVYSSFSGCLKCTKDRASCMFPYFSYKPLVLIGSGRSISTFDLSCFDMRVTKEGFVGFYYHIKTCCLSSNVIRVRCLITVCYTKNVNKYMYLTPNVFMKKLNFPGSTPSFNFTY